MIRVSVMYPTTEGKKFDHDYYANKHMNGLVRERWGSMGLVKASKAHGKELFADVPNFTTIAPQVQISEIILS